MEVVTEEGHNLSEFQQNPYDCSVVNRQKQKEEEGWRRPVRRLFR
jgi:hypothetical protein